MIGWVPHGTLLMRPTRLRLSLTLKLTRRNLAAIVRGGGAEGHTASATPEAWSIVDGKLYLNYSRHIQRRWEKDIPGNISCDTANWPKILG
ncbi:hypothetical protein N9F04_02785 [Ascidiaceihabitans sp.]|nr:hypothetical protein [Ascidiaceihabitans sp.]